MQKSSVVICWFRRDLRLHDQAALYHALKSEWPVLPVFIFDRSILDKLEDKKDRRVEFIHRALMEMQNELQQQESSMDVRYGFPSDVFKQLAEEYDVKAVYTNHDYEPYAIQRDEEIKNILHAKGITFHTYKDQVIFEKSEVVKDDGNPYTVFTPFSRKWRSKLTSSSFASYDHHELFHRHFKQPPRTLISLAEMGFIGSGIPFPVKEVADSLIVNYQQCRDIPSLPGTSRLSVHLRFGTISVRALARRTSPLSETFLNELIWRDFYHMILWHFQQVGQGKSFRKEYDLINWRNNEEEFEKWCEGQTGYPIVDAGMRELNSTGFMHNRVRMVVASFLTKHLLIDWRWGEAYFAKKLLDFDFAANNGGWQWAAGSGCDAAPYFRVFNPYLQTKRFDPELKYIRQWIPEIETLNYPPPIVEHEFARKRCLQVYAEGLKK